MDHLDRPAKPSQDRPRVPYVCLEPYDGTEFQTFPSHCGFQLSEVLAGHFVRRLPNGEEETLNLPQIQSFLQQWLFFSLLNEVYLAVGRSFSYNEYTSHDKVMIGGGYPCSTVRVINTSLLPELFSVWIESFKHKRSSGELSFSDVQQRCKRIAECLRSAYVLCYHLLSSHHTYIENNILLSFICLGAAIDDVLSVVFRSCFYGFLSHDQVKSGVVPSGWNHIPRRWDAPQYLFERLRFKGWCPFDIGILKRDFGTNEILFATQLHRDTRGNRHMKCTDLECIGNDVDEETYKTLHGTLGVCRGADLCSDVRFDYQELCRILREGQIPIVRSQVTSTGMIFDIVPYNPTKISYVAISHVWSHGIGNTKDNTLPRCQLEALHGRTVFVLGSFTRHGGPQYEPRFADRSLSYFWIDTICVPVRPEDKSLRRVAISRMAQTYEQAHAVLVLDQGLLRTSLLEAGTSAPIKPRELAMSILFSDWSRRLWTLQEGVLPDFVWIGFADHSLSLYELSKVKFDEHTQNWADMSTDRVRRAFADLLDKSHMVNDQGLITVDRGVAKRNLSYRRRMFIQLCNRTTSRMGDESICIATLMDIDPQDLIKKERQDRMQKLYECLGIIPAGLVFLPVPKLQTAGFRWAPRSLIGIPISRTHIQNLLHSGEDSEAEVTANGVRLQATGYPLSSLATPLDSKFYILPGTHLGVIPAEAEEYHLTDLEKVRATNTEVIMVKLYDQITEDRYGRAEGFAKKAWKNLAKQDLVNPVLILPKIRRISIDANSGILVTKPELIGNVYHARFLCSVMTQRNPIDLWSSYTNKSGVNTMTEMLKTERTNIANGTRTGKIAWISGTDVLREWCIS